MVWSMPIALRILYLTYVLTTLGSFGIILLLSRSGFEADQISDFKGLNKRHPWVYFIMLLLMFLWPVFHLQLAFIPKCWYSGCG